MKLRPPRGTVEFAEAPIIQRDVGGRYVSYTEAFALAVEEAKACAAEKRWVEGMMEKRCGAIAAMAGTAFRKATPEEREVVVPKKLVDWARFLEWWARQPADEEGDEEGGPRSNLAVALEKMGLSSAVPMTDWRFFRLGMGPRRRSRG